MPGVAASRPRTITGVSTISLSKPQQRVAGHDRFDAALSKPDQPMALDHSESFVRKMIVRKPFGEGQCLFRVDPMKRIVAPEHPDCAGPVPSVVSTRMAYFSLRFFLAVTRIQRDGSQP
jgi:hypothetical protein